MSTAIDMLAAYLAAETAILQGKIGKVGDQSYQFEDLDKVQAGRREWQTKVNEELAKDSGAPRIGGLGFAVARMDQ